MNPHRIRTMKDARTVVTLAHATAGATGAVTPERENRMADTKIWSCKVGEVRPSALPEGADQPMRDAVARAYEDLTGQEPVFIFSGWGAELSPAERAVVNDEEPAETEARLGYATTQELIAELHARAEVGGTIGEPWTRYRTVGSE